MEQIVRIIETFWQLLEQLREEYPNELLLQLPEITLTAIFVTILVILMMVRNRRKTAIKKPDKNDQELMNVLTNQIAQIKRTSPAELQSPDLSSPHISSPGGIHNDWFDNLQNRLNEHGAKGSPFANALEDLRDLVQGGTADKAIEALDTLSQENTDAGNQLKNQSEQHLLGATIARITAGDLALDLENIEAAVQHYRQAIETVPMGHDALLAECLNNHAMALYRNDEHDKALISFRRALKLLERFKGPNDTDVASVLNNLAMLYYEKGDGNAARPLYERALKIDEAADGADSLAVATDLNNLGLLLKHQNLADEAEPLLRRALNIKEKALSADHPSLVTGLRNYAALLRAQGRDEEASELDTRIPS